MKATDKETRILSRIFNKPKVKVKGKNRGKKKHKRIVKCKHQKTLGTFCTREKQAEIQCN